MEEKKNPEEVAAETETAPEQDTQSPPEQQPAKRSFLFTYIFALLFIALLLVFLSYLSQLRATRAQIENLTEEHNLFSVSAMGSIDKLTAELEETKERANDLRSERDALKAERDELLSGSEELQSKLTAAEGELSELNEEYAVLWNENNELGSRLTALSLATEITQLVAEEDYEGAAALADTFVGSSLEELVETDYPTQYTAYTAAIEVLNENFMEE